MKLLPRHETLPYTTTTESLVFLHDPLLDYKLAATNKDLLVARGSSRAGRFGQFITRLLGQ